MAVTRIGLQIPNFTFAGVADADLFEHVAAIAVAPRSRASTRCG